MADGKTLEKISKTTYTAYDYKQGGCEEDWTSALKNLGVFVYEMETFSGSDMFGFLLSKEKLNKAECKLAEEYHCGE